MVLMLDPEFHWLRQIATTMRQFLWLFLNAIAKAKKLIRESNASFTDKEFLSFGNGI